MPAGPRRRPLRADSTTCRIASRDSQITSAHEATNSNPVPHNRPPPGAKARKVSALVGVTLALLVAVFARLSGFDRDRSFYATVLIVIASYYVLFAAMAGSSSALILESMVMATFAVFAVAGFRSRPWLIVAGLAGHGVMDSFHHYIVTNPGVPAWWPGFCLGYDVGAAVFLAWIIRSRTALAQDSAPSRAS